MRSRRLYAELQLKRLNKNAQRITGCFRRINRSDIDACRRGLINIGDAADAHAFHAVAFQSHRLL